MKYNISNLYIGFSFETGKLLPLLKVGESCPDRLFGNNQSYCDLYDMHYYWVNDAGVDMPNCSSLFCVKPFEDYIKMQGDISRRNTLKVFNQIIPLYLENQSISQKIIEIKELYKMYADDITKESNGKPNSLLKNYLTVINNLDKTIADFELNQNRKGLKR